MKGEQWVIQGRVLGPDSEWMDLRAGRKRKVMLCKINWKIAKTIGADYRVVLKVFEPVPHVDDETYLVDVDYDDYYEMRLDD